MIKKQYKYIGNEFAGATSELQSQITELKEKINQKKRLEYALDKEKILKAANTSDVVDATKNINYPS